MTRAKAAALGVDELAMPSKGALQTKKSTSNMTAAATRKRAALGDVSNFGKTDGEGKKGKTGLKASQPTGIVKSTARSTRGTSAGKEPAKKAEAKRNGSGAGAIGHPPKRKVAAPKEKAIVNENEPIRKEARTTEIKRVRAESEEEEDVVKVEPEAEPEVEGEVNVLGEKYPPGVKDLDSEDLEDPLMVAEYATEIFEYLRDLECHSVPNPQYMAHQDDLEWKTRGILIDWLVEVHTRFHLLPETLFLTVNIIDRFLSEKVVQLDRLQLVGITAMFIASKYEEVLSPHVENFKRIADDGFTEAEILSAERFVLSTLDYDLSYPNPMNFLRRISKADNYDIQSRTIGKYLMEISLLDHRFMSYRPSHIAAASMYLARMMLDRGPWVC